MTAVNLAMCYQELGFIEPPFRITPDTDFFFPGSRHLEALSHFVERSGGAESLRGGVVQHGQLTPDRCARVLQFSRLRGEYQIDVLDIQSRPPPLQARPTASGQG